MTDNVKKHLILFLLLSILQGCEEEINKEAPPSRVMIVQKSADTSAVEKGIDAIFNNSRPDTNSLIIEWHPNQENTLEGYLVYRSESEDKNYVAIAKLTKNFNVIDTFFVDNSVLLHQRYYYYIKAFDEFEQFSEASDTVNYYLVDTPVLSAPVANIGNNLSPTFIWDFHHNYIPHFFIFRIERNENDVYKPLYTKLLELGVDYDPHQEWPLDELTPSSTLSQGLYRWRIDPVGSEPYQGAESRSVEFVIQ